MGAKGFSVTTKDTRMSEPLLSLRVEHPVTSIADWESHLKSLAAGLEKDTQHEWAMFAASVVVPAAAFARPSAWIALLGGTAAAASQYLYQRLESPEKDIELLPIVGAGLIGALGAVAGIRVFKWMTKLAAQDGAVMASGMAKTGLRETGRVWGRTPKPPRSRGHLRVVGKPDDPLPPTPAGGTLIPPPIPVTPLNRIAAARCRLSVSDTATQEEIVAAAAKQREILRSNNQLILVGTDKGNMLDSELGEVTKAEELLLAMVGLAKKLPKGTLCRTDLVGMTRKLQWDLLGLKPDRAYSAEEIHIVFESFNGSSVYLAARNALMAAFKPLK